MLNEERVVLMTEIAMFEEKANHKLQPATKYLKQDYISLSSFGGVIFGSVFFACIYMAAIVSVLIMVDVDLTKFLIVVLIILGVILYALFMYFFMRGIKKAAAKRYDKSKELVKIQRKAYAKLLKLYEKEEAQDIPDAWG